MLQGMPGAFGLSSNSQFIQTGDEISTETIVPGISPVKQNDL
jgi:hypothetical protein